MAITLRTVAGTALSHTQVDTNFCSLFYSASVSGQTLTFYKTGSSGLGVPVASSSLTLTGLNYWTASGANLTTNSGVIITGSLINGYPGLLSTANYTHVEGRGTIASAELAHAEGRTTVASGYASHAEGFQTVASATGSHSEGLDTNAQGLYSHAEGNETYATGYASHAEGQSNNAIADFSHAEGSGTNTYGVFSHAEGFNTKTGTNKGYHLVSSSIASGSFDLDSSYGNLTANHNFGDIFYMDDSNYEANYGIGLYTISHSLFTGGKTRIYLTDNTIVTKEAVGGNVTWGIVNWAGDQTFGGEYAHSEGGGSNTAIGVKSHVEGNNSEAWGYSSHAEGWNTQALGELSHAEGFQTTAYGGHSHAEGANTNALGDYSHAEGYYSLAAGEHSHAEGSNTQALGSFSHAEGYGTIASGSYQHVQGQFNISSSAQSAFIIGNGTSLNNPRNLVFASGSQFQISGSLGITGSEILQGSTPVYFGTRAQISTSSYAIFKDAQDRLTIGNWVQEGYGSDGIKIDTSGKVQLNHVSQNYGVYDTTLNIIGSGSNDGITLTQWPDTSNRYRITIQSGSAYKLNFSNSLHPSSGSYNFSGSVNITNELTVNGNKQFNHGMFYHTASISVANGSSGSALLSTTAVANGVSITNGSRITVENPGYYNIQFSAQLTQGANTANYYIWFKKNGTNIANSMSKKTLANNTNGLMTVDIIDYASNVGDYYEIVHQSDAANSTLEYIAASGNYPAAPSLIVTVQQVR